MLGFECTINPQDLIKIVVAIFEKIKIFNFFSCELPLILGVGGKLKKMAGDICERTLDVDFERDWWVGLGPALGDGKHLKYIFSVSGIFPEKFANITLMGFKCSLLLIHKI